jgi:hypothetical protein
MRAGGRRAVSCLMAGRSCGRAGVWAGQRSVVDDDDERAGRTGLGTGSTAVVGRSPRRRLMEAVVVDDVSVGR